MSRGGPRDGAGRPATRTKLENCKAIDVASLNLVDEIVHASRGGQRWTSLATGAVTGFVVWSVRPSRQYITVWCAPNGWPKVTCVQIGIEWTRCNFGGMRAWFACPRCARRTSKLYHHRSSFACRVCHGLVYASQSEGVCGRSWRNQLSLQARLDNGTDRPKGMQATSHAHVLQGIAKCQELRLALLRASALPTRLSNIAQPPRVKPRSDPRCAASRGSSSRNS